jgi:hypothetical protein
LWSTSPGIKTFSIQLWRRLNKLPSYGQCSWRWCITRNTPVWETHLLRVSRICACCGWVSSLGQDGVIKPQSVNSSSSICTRCFHIADALVCGRNSAMVRKSPIRKRFYFHIVRTVHCQ